MRAAILLSPYGSNECRPPHRDDVAYSGFSRHLPARGISGNQLTIDAAALACLRACASFSLRADIDGGISLLARYTSAR